MALDLVTYIFHQVDNRSGNTHARFSR